MFRAAEFSKFKSVPRPAARPSDAFLISLAVLAVLAHAVMAVTGTIEKSTTADEIAHLTAGQAYNTRADFRLHPENGNLPQRLAALPMTLGGVSLPATELESWRTADIWNYGYTFFYRSGIALDWWLFLGRAMIALVSGATGLLIFCWSRALFGWRGAFLSLTLFVFSPTFLAHGALATSDVVMTFFFVASLGAWWRHLEHPGPWGATLSALTTGVACVAKFSSVLLGPMLGGCALVWALGTARRTGWPPVLFRLARTSVVHMGAIGFVIWLFYGCRFAAFAPELATGASFNHGWGTVLTGLGWPARIIFHLKEWHVLPEAWLYGFAFVLQFSQARGAFLNGEYSIAGWPAFFPFAFLVKTTVPLLLLVAATLVAALRRAARTPRTTLSGWLARYRWFIPLALLFVVYWAMSITSHLNIGHRHILPTYPVIIIAAGWLGRLLTPTQPLMATVVSALAVWHGAESIGIRPHYLAYFNQSIGGPANGWRHLVDSSLDWGQDLPGLKAWLRQYAPGEKVYLAYFGTGDPAYEGIAAQRLPSLPEVGVARPWHALGAGVYAVSVTMLQQVYSPTRGDWTLALEKEYQQLRTLEPAFLAYQEQPVRRAEVLREMPAADWAQAWKRYEVLRFARLCYCLRPRVPQGHAGYSILIYRLTEPEVAAATGGSLADWRALIERTVAESTKPPRPSP